MTRTTALTPVFALVPTLIFTAVIGTGGYFGATSLMGQMPGAEYDCKVTQFEKTSNPDEYLIHTDGCSDSASTEGKVFKANIKDLSTNFTEEKFYEGVKSGKTFNLTLQGMNVKQFNITPTITKVSESMMPY